MTRNVMGEAFDASVDAQRRLRVRYEAAEAVAKACATYLVEEDACQFCGWAPATEARPEYPHSKDCPLPAYLATKDAR